MAFVGVEFSEEGGGSISLVNKNWLTPRKQEVFWPPYKEIRPFERALKNGEDPKTDKGWKVYSITRIFFECDDYEKANLKLKRAQITSDVQTDADDELPLKRKSVPARRFSFSDSGEDSDSSLSPSSKNARKLERPPPLKVKILSNNIIESSHNQSPKNEIYEQHFDSHNLTPSTSRSVPLQDTPLSKDSSNNEIVLPHKFYALLAKIQQQNAEILDCVKTQAPTLPTLLASVNLPNNLPVQLPLGSEEDLLEFEGFLLEPANVTNLTSYLSTLGGRDVNVKINSILRRVITNKLASSFNYFGKRSAKKPFCELKIKNVIIAAAKEGDITEKQLEDAIKVWLKHAPQRAKNEEAKERQ